MGLRDWPLTEYIRCRPSSRTPTSPTSLSTRRCLETNGCARPISLTRSFTGRSPPERTSRICRRRGSATALNASAVVAARAMIELYAYMGICQGLSCSKPIAHRYRYEPRRHGPPRPFLITDSRAPGSEVCDEAWTDLGRVLAAPTRGCVAHDVFGVERGLYVLRTPERPIGLDGDAPGSGPRVDQVERDVRTGIGEQSCALADDDGIGEQVELVDQVVGEQPSDEGTAAGHQQCAVLMRLQITDGPGEVAVQDSRARPLCIGEAGRCHVLGPAVQRGGDRARARIGHRSPGAGEDLVRPPAKEERGRAAVDLVEIVPGFGVEKWYGPSAALEAAAAILVRSAQPLHHAVHRDVGRGRQFHGRRSLLAEFVVVRFHRTAVPISSVAAESVRPIMRHAASAASRASSKAGSNRLDRLKYWI